MHKDMNDILVCLWQMEGLNMVPDGQRVQALMQMDSEYIILNSSFQWTYKKVKCCIKQESYKLGPVWMVGPRIL